MDKQLNSSTRDLRIIAHLNKEILNKTLSEDTSDDGFATSDKYVRVSYVVHFLRTQHWHKESPVLSHCRALNEVTKNARARARSRVTII
jgi:hypothetical protein